MTDTPLQVAKREVQELLQARPIWIGLLAAGVILGVMGPFGTDAVMPLLPRLVYWTCLASASFVLGSVGSGWGFALSDRLQTGFLTGLILGGDSIDLRGRTLGMTFCL